MKRAVWLGIVLLGSVLFIGPTTAWAVDDDALVGVWKTTPKDGGFAHVEITRDGDRFHGKIIFLSEPEYPQSEGPEWAGKPKVDRKNPDTKLRDRTIVGLPLVWNFAHKGEGRWEGGKIYDPENGKTYKCKMSMTDPDVLGVRGFIGFSLIGRTTQWTRVEAAAPSTGN